MKYSILAVTIASALSSVQADPTWFYGQPKEWTIWTKEKDFCAAKGGRLCTYKELCPSGHFSAPAGIKGGPHDSWAQDKWVAIKDHKACATNGWVMLGDHSSFKLKMTPTETIVSPEKCWAHDEFPHYSGGLWGCPAWGTTLQRGPAPYFQTKVCCGIPKPTPPKPTPSASGDPHFETWSGEKFDFNGGCDLVLLQNNHFANGLGMNIHVRTSIRKWWSYIETAILQIGDNTLQIKGGMEGSVKYWINGEEKELETGKGSLGDFALAFRRINDHQSQTRIDLGNHGDAISIETWKDFVKVNVKNVKNTNFEGSVGMLGAYPDGKKVGRDGETVFEDTDAFGQEWMVRPSDKILFADVDVENFPLQCTMPDAPGPKEKRRRLGEGGISEEDAEIACSRVDEAHREACIFDVMATMDLEMAGSY